jgi:hypothetical protein
MARRMSDPRPATLTSAVRFVSFLGLLVLAAATPRETLAQAAAPPVISLKSFTSVPEWQLDITWHARDSFEDEDFRAGLDMTVTASYFLKRLDKTDSWAEWEIQQTKATNVAFSSFLLDKRNGQRLEYQRTAQPPISTAANLQVGGQTPGYQLVCEGLFPLKTTQPQLATFETPLHLGTTELGDVPRFCTGPLPAPGSTIAGSTVVLAVVPPFGSSRAPRTRVAIQYVLQPVPLAPLVPPTKRPR